MAGREELLGRGGSPDGFPPSFSLLRLILPDQSLVPTASTVHAGGAQVSHILPRIPHPQSRSPWDAPGGCVGMYRFLSWGLCCHPEWLSCHDHIPSHFRAINLIS